MGGGASSQMGVEELLTSTYMIGRAISAITFPGMYRIYDFHSKEAPKLKNAQKFSFFAPDSDDEYDDDEETPNSSNYEHLFNVLVGEDKIYLDDPLYINEGGWTALHSCCMSFLTVQAGCLIIDEILKRGGSLDDKTINGPGTFNRGWTALQMACAYGVEPLVERLIDAGADVNATNSFGYSPLLDACHRGFINIVNYLIKGGADLRYIPSDEDSNGSPFASAPAHCALGEAARCGFQRVVQSLLDGGASKDQCNSLGWTALHEACFYNRIETVKILLLSGANANARTKQGAMPYHLAGLQIIRTMLKDIGGDDAVPVPGDVIDMVSVLRALTTSEAIMFQASDGTLQIMSSSNGDETSNPAQSSMSFSESPAQLKQSPDKFQKSISNSLPTNNEGNSASKHRNRNSPIDRKMINNNDDSSPLLHSGAILGDLPSLEKASPDKINNHMHNVLSNPDRNYAISSKADDKINKNKKKNRDNNINQIPKDIPNEYLCQLSMKPMTEPVQTIYGNIFENSTICNWFIKQGRICPLTGAPLSESDLKPMIELGDKIRKWLLDRSTAPLKEKSNSSELTGAKSSVNTSLTVPDDDLYDF